jgi:hypothetical protein
MKMWSGVILLLGVCAAALAQTFTSDLQIGGKMVHSRYVIAEASPTSYMGKWETSEDGQSWSAWMEMKATKVPAKK